MFWNEHTRVFMCTEAVLRYELTLKLLFIVLLWMRLFLKAHVTVKS